MPHLPLYLTASLLDDLSVSTPLTTKFVVRYFYDERRVRAAQDIHIRFSMECIRERDHDS